MDDSASAAGTPARRSRRSPRTRSVLVATGVLVLGLSSFAVAKSGDVLREGKRNGTTKQETQIVGNIKAGSGATGGYVTRQSNLSASGGGAVYGCRSGAAPSNNPCIRANNLDAGRAFSFNTNSGLITGYISAGAGGDTKKPFTTNATGVATGLNADRLDSLNASEIISAARLKMGLDADTVDGQSASALKERWVLVGADGMIIKQTGGFSLVNCYAANDNCYIDAGGDVRNNGVHAQIVTANNPDAGVDGQLSGDTSAAACFFDFVNCGPPGTDDSNGGNPGVFVVTPRNSDGSAPAVGDRYPFYAYVTGSQAQ